MRPSRRELLLGASAAGLLGATPTGPTRSAKNLVIVLAWGGWDTTVAVDPKPRAPAPVPRGRVVHHGDIPLWKADLWPAADACFGRWGDLAHVVRGVSVRTVSHVVALRRMLTGTPDPGAPDVGAILGATAGADTPLPYLTLGPRALPGDLAAISASAGLGNQLGDLVGETLLDPLEEAAVARAVDAADARLQASGLGPAARGRVDDLIASRARADALIGRSLGPSGALGTFADQSAIAAHALADGLSRAVLVDSGIDFDTHVGNDEQPARTDALFQGVDHLLDLLATTPSGGGVLLDDTVVWLVSEMTRTPRVNAGGGKDHWPWATSVLFGAGVRHGVTGTTDDEQAGTGVDLVTGRPGSTELRGGHMVAGLLEHLGVDSLPWLADAPLRSFSAG